MSNKVRVFVAAVVVAAVFGLAALIASGDPITIRSAQAAACFACLGIFAQFLSYSVDRKRASTVLLIPFLSTIYLAPTWVSLVAIAGVATVGAVIIKRPAVKSTFNVAKALLSGALAIAVYRAFGGTAVVGAIRVQLVRLRRRIRNIPIGQQPPCCNVSASSGMRELHGRRAEVAWKLAGI